MKAPTSQDEGLKGSPGSPGSPAPPACRRWTGALAQIDFLASSRSESVQPSWWGERQKKIKDW